MDEGSIIKKTTEIEILNQSYQIINIDNKSIDENNLGKADIRYNQIYLKSDMSYVQKVRTLLHEIIHIISDELELELKENQVSGIAVGLTNTDIFKIMF